MDPILVAGLLTVGIGMLVKTADSLMSKDTDRKKETSKLKKHERNELTHMTRVREKQIFTHWPEDWYTKCDCNECNPPDLDERLMRLEHKVADRLYKPHPRTAQVSRALGRERVGTKLIIKGGRASFVEVWGTRVFNPVTMNEEIVDGSGKVLKVL